MEPKPFLKKLSSGYSGKVSESSYFGLTWYQWAKFAEMACGLDYGCNFNAKGKPCSGKSVLYSGSPQPEMCCCGSCKSHFGYLELIPNNEEAIKEIASLFDDKNHGFWRKQKGCILPAKYRSDTCVAYRCPDARKYRDNMGKYAYGSDLFEQMLLYFLDTLRSSKLNATQVRTIIKELIK